MNMPAAIRVSISVLISGQKEYVMRFATDLVRYPHAYAPTASEVARAQDPGWPRQMVRYWR